MNLILEGNISTLEVLSALTKNFTVNVKAEKVYLHKKEVLVIEASNSIIQLNKKEVLILNYLKEGYEYKEIANLMDMTVDGVRFYTKKIYKKLGVNNARQAIFAISDEL
jgi:DNA-binding CsgD family transcriptional regulator